MSVYTAYCIRNHSCLLRIATLLFVWIAGALYAGYELDHGWWPNNAGAIGLSAERVLKGELPHRDFDEIYTGGVDYLHALAFKLLGTNLASMRRVLFAVFLTWIPAVYYIATRFTGPMTAGMVSLLAVTWSLPIYSEPIASWYNLFFATHGAAALLRYLETNRRRWLFVAGVCGGLSCLVKIIGLCFLAATGLCLLLWEQCATRRGGRITEGLDNSTAITTRGRSVAYTAFLILTLLTFVVLLASVIHRHHGLNGIIHFVVPCMMLGAFLLWNEFIAVRTSSAVRFRALWHLLSPFVSGVGLIISLFLVLYVFDGSLNELARGLFVSPLQRLTVTSNPPPNGLITLIATLPIVILLALSSRWPWRVQYVMAGGLLPVLAIVTWTGNSWPYYALIILTIRGLIPIVVVSGIIMFVFPGCAGVPWRQTGSLKITNQLKWRMTFTLLAVSGLCNLVQFPVAETIYIFFIAPFGLLTLLAVLSYQRSEASPVFVVLVLFYLIFSSVWINTSIHEGRRYALYVPDDQTEVLNIDRAGGIRVRAKEKAEYEALVTLLRKCCYGEYIFATPDCPEVYFLSGFSNPTRTTYDFFDDPQDRDRIKYILAAKDIKAIVLNHRPQYSAPPPSELVAYLCREYPQVTEIGSFEVRWKP
jgi:hypothetical protein